MIVRQWKGWAQKDRASDYVRYFATQLQPKLSTIPGYRKALVLTREQGGETEIVTMTFFDRLEDVAGFAGDRYEVANVSAGRKPVNSGIVTRTRLKVAEGAPGFSLLEAEFVIISNQ